MSMLSGGPAALFEAASPAEVMVRCACERAFVHARPPQAEAASGTQAVGMVEDALARLSHAPELPVALAIRLPFCATHCLFCERDVLAAQPSGVIDGYAETLAGELELLSSRVGPRRPLAQVVLGGGCADELGESALARLACTIERRFRVLGETEMSAECDPRRVTRGQLQLLRGLGFRRVTFGVFDLDPAVQRSIGRVQSARLIDDACAAARSSGLRTVQLDLMTGLPGQTASGWRATLDRLLSIAPDRIGLHRYRHHPERFGGHAMLEADDGPEDGGESLAALAAELLLDAGYRWIGAGLFVLDDDDLFVAAQRGRLRCGVLSYGAGEPAPVLAVGSGALGEIGGLLYWNMPSMPAWRSAVQHGGLPVAEAWRPAAPQSRQRDAVEHLLCRLELPRGLCEDGLEAGWHRVAGRATDGLVRVVDDRLELTPKGRLSLPMLCRELAVSAAVARVQGLQ